MSHEDCPFLFEAGKALVEKSGLANYCGQCFVACDNEAAFNRYWQDEFHPEFGRYMAWVLFSVGAENLAKAACVCNKVVKVKFNLNLRRYMGSKGHFEKLCKEAGLCDGAKDTLQQGYKCLTKIRDRDAHSYRKDVRSANFH